MDLKSKMYRQWQVDQMVAMVALLDYDQCSRMLLLVKEEVQYMRGNKDVEGVCRCHFCKKDFTGLLPSEPWRSGTTVCEKCAGYQAYLAQFPKEVRHRMLRNRRCVQCRINKVDSPVQSRRICKSCWVLSKTAGKGKSRAFFQLMAMQSVIEPITGEAQ